MGVQGPNLLKLARKEQCLALLTQLRTKFKLDGQFYRVFPNGEVRPLVTQALTCFGGPPFGTRITSHMRDCSLNRVLFRGAISLLLCDGA